MGDDEAYNVYDQPWNSSTTVASQIYKPTKTKDNYDGAEALVNASKRFVLFLLIVERVFIAYFRLGSIKNMVLEILLKEFIEMGLFNLNVKAIYLA